MPFSVKNDEADVLLSVIRGRNGNGITETVVRALRYYLERLEKVTITRRQAMEACLDRFDRHQIVDHRRDDDIFGYDDRGLAT